MLLKEHIGKLIKYDNYFWKIEDIKNGEAELWYNGNCRFVALDDLDESNVVEMRGEK